MGLFESVELPPDFWIEEVGESAELPSSDLLEQVDDLWHKESKRRRDVLFNGSLLTLVGPDAHLQLRDRGRLVGVFTEYRFFIAQQAAPVLYEELKIRPIAVAGIVRAGEYVLFARRANTVTQDPGYWELLPSGGLSPRSRVPPNRIDPEFQVLKELVEETAIPQSVVQSVTPRLVLVDNMSHVHDIVLELNLTISAIDAERHFGSRQNREYVDVRSVHHDGLEEFIRLNRVSNSSAALVRAIS